MTYKEAVTSATKLDGCRGRPLTAQEIIIGNATDIICEARNFIEGIWMAMAEVEEDIAGPIRAIADAAKAKLGEALAKLEKPTAANEH